MVEIDYVEVRKRIIECPDPFLRACLSTIFLCCARASEVVGFPRPREKVYPLEAEALQEITFSHNGKDEPLLLITIKTAKRGGIPRRIPIAINHDPLAKYVIFHKNLMKKGILFPINRDILYRETKKLGVFSDLKYNIYPYIYENRKVPEHEKNAGIHFLRHARANELAYHYGLTTEEIASLGGWKLSTMSGIAPNILTPVMERYIHINYHKFAYKMIYPAPPYPPRT